MKIPEKNNPFLSHKELERYEKFLKKNYATRVVSWYKNQFIGFVNFTEKKLNNIAQEDFLKYVSHMKKKKYSDSMINSFIKSSKLFYTEILGKPNLDFLKRIKKDPSKPAEHLSKAEIEKLLKTSMLESNKKSYPMLATMYYGGLKMSELSNLKWKDINFKTKKINIDSVYFNSRTIEMAPELYACLLNYKNDDTIKKSKDWVFVGRATADGEHISERSIERTIELVVKKANLKSKVNGYILRNSRAVHLKNSGKTFKEIQDFLGIKSNHSMKFYKNVYGSSSKSKK